VLIAALCGLLSACGDEDSTGEAQAEALVFYRNAVRELRASTFEREADTPGWMLVEGRAADAYFESLEACPSDAVDSNRLDSVRQDAIRVLTQTIEPRSVPRQVSGACRLLGAPRRSELLGAVDDPLLCRSLASCLPSLEAMLAGSYMSDARSPAFVFEPRAVVDSDTEGERTLVDFLPFIRNAKIALVIAALKSHTAPGRREAVRELAGVARAGRDLARGGVLLATMVGLATTGIALDGMIALLRAPDLEKETAEAALAELRYMGRRPISLRQLWLAEHVVSSGELVGEDPSALPPTRVRLPAPLPTAGMRRILVRCGEFSSRGTRRRGARGWRASGRRSRRVSSSRVINYPATSSIHM